MRAWCLRPTLGTGLPREGDDLSLHEQLRDTGVQEQTSSREGERVWSWEAGELSTDFVYFTMLPLWLEVIQ